MTWDVRSSCLRAGVTDPIKLKVVIGDSESVLSCQPFLDLLEEDQFLCDELGIVDDPAAAVADEVVVMIPAGRPLDDFESRASVAEVELENKPDVDQDLQGPVNGCEADGRVEGVDLHVDLFRAQVPLRLGQDIEYGLPGGGHSIARFPDFCHREALSALFDFYPAFHPEPPIENDCHFQLLKRVDYVKGEFELQICLCNWRCLCI